MKVTIHPKHTVTWCCEKHYQESEAKEAEIRRLREAVPSVVIEPQCLKTGCEADIWRMRQKTWEANLAAHQAVVRELAEASKKYIDEVQANLRAAHSTVPGPADPPRWAALQHLQAWLAHPLVRQAREEKG